MIGLEMPNLNDEIVKCGSDVIEFAKSSFLKKEVWNFYHK